MRTIHRFFRISELDWHDANLNEIHEIVGKEFPDLSYPDVANIVDNIKKIMIHGVKPLPPLLSVVNRIRQEYVIVTMHVHD